MRRPRARSPSVAALALALALGGCSGGALGPAPGAGGAPDGASVLLVSDRGGALRIYEIAPADGSARLIGSADASNTAYRDTMPARLPDGRVVFVSDRDGNPEIYLASADGRTASRLTGDVAGLGRFAIHSDPAPLGRDRIVFARTDAGAPAGSPRDIYVVRVDGSEMRRLTRHPADDSAPTSPPDGRSVVFVSDRSGSPRLQMIRDVDAADAEATLIDLSRAAPPGPGDAGRPFSDRAPAFLADGSLVFSRAYASGPPQLFLMGAGGTHIGLRQITESLVMPYGAEEPVALGADSILFTTCLSAEKPGGGTAERCRVYRIAAGGFNLAKLTRDLAHYSDFSRRLSPRG
jgi:hypothetical protein